MIADRVPISLVTGFLGSGKTTLIAALLKQPAMAGTAVIVNEIGAVGIDDAIFAATIDQGDVVLLSNGCLCCAAGDDLALVVWRLIQRPDPPRRIVIETSGLADPAPALRRLIGDPRVRLATRLDAVITTVDAINGLRDLDEQPLAARQAAFADRRLITKTDLADSQTVDVLRERLRELNPAASVEEVAHGAIDADRLFDASLYDAETGEAALDRWLGLEEHRAAPYGRRFNPSITFGGGPADDTSVGTWLLEENRPLDWRIFSPRLGDIIARYGDRLLRLKGAIQTVGDPRPLVVHGVQRIFHSPVRLERWTRPPATTVVAIGDNGARQAVELIADAIADAAELAPRPASENAAIQQELA